MTEFSTAVGDRYIDGTYLVRNPGWHEQDAPWKAQQICRMLERQSMSPRSLCDIGCGSGGVLAELRTLVPRSIELVGYEPSPEAAAIASAQPGVRIVTGDATQCHEHFDLVISLDVMEHVEDYFAFLRAIRGIADYYIFHIPLDMSVQGVLRAKPILYVRESVGHLHYFSADTARAALTGTGFKIKDEFFTAGGLELPGLSTKARLAAIPRRILFRVQPHLTVRILGGYSLLVLATD